MPSMPFLDLSSFLRQDGKRVVSHSLFPMHVMLPRSHTYMHGSALLLCVACSGLLRVCLTQSHTMTTSCLQHRRWSRWGHGLVYAYVYTCRPFVLQLAPQAPTTMCIDLAPG